MKPFYWLLFIGLIIVGIYGCVRETQAHDWYSGIRNPATGAGCCGGADCGPVALEEIAEFPDRFELTPNRSRQYLVKGSRYIFPKSISMPTREWNPDDPNDTGYHACVGSSGKPLCFFYPQGA